VLILRPLGPRRDQIGQLKVARGRGNRRRAHGRSPQAARTPINGASASIAVSIIVSARSREWPRCRPRASPRARTVPCTRITSRAVSNSARSRAISASAAEVAALPGFGPRRDDNA
jgi:hypothetical protein